VELGLIGSTFCIATPDATVVVVTRTSLLAGCFGDSVVSAGGLTRARVLSPESALSLGTGLDVKTGGVCAGTDEAGAIAFVIGPLAVVAAVVGGGGSVFPIVEFAKLTGKTCVSEVVVAVVTVFVEEVLVVDGAAGESTLPVFVCAVIVEVVELDIELFPDPMSELLVTVCVPTTEAAAGAVAGAGVTT